MFTRLLVLSLAAWALMPAVSHAVLYGGVEFPQGAVSFADSLVSYDNLFSGGPAPTDPNYLDASDALGIPDYNGSTGSVSLGSGGRIVLRFTDNSLTASGNADNDIWIFEIGPDVEDTFVDISKDGVNWESVGKVTGSTRGIDIDAFGWGLTDFFSFVRLTDDPNEGDNFGSTVGADIDAVGAISSSRPVTIIPEPATLSLLGLGLGSMLLRRRRKPRA